MKEHQFENREISLPIIIMRKGKWFVASCLNLDIATQGETKQEVKENMEDLIEEYLKDKDIINKNIKK